MSQHPRHEPSEHQLRQELDQLRRQLAAARTAEQAQRDELAKLRRELAELAERIHRHRR